MGPDLEINAKGLYYYYPTTDGMPPPWNTATLKTSNVMYIGSEPEWKRKMPIHMRKRKVIFHAPATIVLWEDGTRTVVKCDPGDTYDPKYGLALCYMKKALGNTSRALNDVLHGELDGMAQEAE